MRFISPPTGVSKSETMKSTSAFLFCIYLSRAYSLTSYVTHPQQEKGSSWPGKTLQSKSMMDNINLFSPRMDYDEWTPLGRGDPLKNDPTYDYVPPVLERVHYWMDPSKRTPDPPLPNSGVLVLGSRTESTFTTRPTTPRYQSFQSKESQADSRIDTSSLLDPFFKLMDVSQFNLNFNSNANYKPVPNKIQRPQYQNNKHRTPPPQALQRPPYTMLMPPPPPPPPLIPESTNYITTVPDKTQTTVPIPPTSHLPPAAKNATTINPTVLANTENVFKPVAISMPGTVEPVENETQNEITVKAIKKPTTEATTYTTQQTPTRPPKRPEKQEYHATTPYVKHIQTNHIKTPPRPQDVDDKNIKKPTKVPPWFRETENRATITPPVTTTRVNSLTTDPMFKHYKQPSEPIKGPFYLIIQGHSKVKTYGASKNPINRLLTSNEIKYDEEESKKTKFERKTRRLRYDTLNQDGDNKVDANREEMRSLTLTGEDNLENLEETFGKTNGGSSKKRYLGSNHRRKRSVQNGNRRLLSEPDCEAEGRNGTAAADNLDLESLIAISDDYDPEDVANILLKDEGGQGSGFGNFVLSIASRSEEGEDI